MISVKLTEAQFEGQTKAKLGNAYIRTLVDGLVSDQLAVYPGGESRWWPAPFWIRR